MASKMSSKTAIKTASKMSVPMEEVETQTAEKVTVVLPKKP